MCKKSVSICKVALGKDQPVAAAGTYINMVLLLNEMRMHHKTLFWCKKALALYKDKMVYDPSIATVAYHGMGLILKNMGECQQTLEV